MNKDLLTNKPGVLILMSGPSGAGKSTVCRPLLDAEKTLDFSVSCTTRQPREGEEDGVHYHFITKEYFEQKIITGDFLEYAEVHGNYYGTLKSEVEERILNGNDVLLDIDVQGAMQIKEMLKKQKESAPDSFCLYDCIIYVFITPPSYEELEIRLKGRGTETEESLAKRLNNARQEMDHQLDYDYLIVNDDLGKAQSDLQAILQSARCRTSLIKFSK